MNKEQRLARKLQNVNVSAAVIQEICGPQLQNVNNIENTSFKHYIYYDDGDSTECGVGFMVIGKQMKQVIRWEPVSYRIFVLSIFVLRMINPMMIKMHRIHLFMHRALTENAYQEGPKHDVKLVIVANEQIGKEFLPSYHWYGAFILQQFLFI